jgi:hypothetical protein
LVGRHHPWYNGGAEQAASYGHETDRAGANPVSEIAERTANPNVSPTYPQRVHIRERAQWQALLKTWEDRIASASQSLATLPPGPDRSVREFLIVQMAGARDQLADAVRRLPMEVGSLYKDDRLRADEAVAALERLFRRWEDKNK